MPMPITVEAPPPVALTWETLCTDPRFAFLNDLPFKVETNEWSQVVMSPTFQRHGFLQVQVALLLDKLTSGGAVVTESAVRTAKGVKVPDVAWYDAARWAQVKDAYDAPIAPNVCVEVLSPTNHPAEIEEKRRLYFEAGAMEVWTCEESGRLRFFDRDAERARSALIPGFPTRIGD